MVWKLDVIVDIAEKGLGKVVTSFYATMLLTGCPNCRKPLLLNVNYSESLSAPFSSCMPVPTICSYHFDFSRSWYVDLMQG